LSLLDLWLHPIPYNPSSFHPSQLSVFASSGECREKELAAVIAPNAPRKAGAKSGDEVAA
jgi:hypothetical protein